MANFDLNNVDGMQFDVLRELGNIGAGNATDGQILVSADMLGLTQGFRPKFLRQYANLSEIMTDAIGSYILDTKEGTFPSAAESY